MPTVIAVDVDEVLGGFVPALCEYHNDKFGTKLELSDFHSYRFNEVWGGSNEESSQKVSDFHKTALFQNLPLIRGAKEGVKQLQARGYELVVVTSRHLTVEQETRTWLERHFSVGTFSRVLMGNHWATHGRRLSKAELCAQVGAQVLIDDSLVYAREVAGVGVHALLFDLDGRYPWSKCDDAEMPPAVTRVRNWEEVVRTIDFIVG